MNPKRLLIVGGVAGGLLMYEAVKKVPGARCEQS